MRVPEEEEVEVRSLVVKELN